MIVFFESMPMQHMAVGTIEGSLEGSGTCI